ncbi:MAG: carboxypeptidase-like regulatory domain-containing protein [Williamsia sp.]|nr:carboxypeptidase-like regulatory domain-containing protein [Williamsia sp.]
MRTLLIVLVFISSSCFAGKISGTVTDQAGHPLGYASILVKGTGIGTTANSAGNYFLELEPGKYTLVCQYVGYERVEKSITLSQANETLNFTLALQQTSMKEVVVKPGGEDPAYEIIRNAIKKRNYYLNQVPEFQCQVYTKGQLKLRGTGKKIFGQKIDLGDDDGDTSKAKMLYLTESIATYSVHKPGKVKIDVTSTKVSGESDGFGLSHPQFISFYENNINIASNLNRRGFVSPIADNALNYYRFKYRGVFVEDGKEVNKIEVIPKRKYDPLFSGYINITENDWRIHSVQLRLTKESQIDLLDTLRIEQLYIPLEKDVWVIKSQVLYPAAKFFGIEAYGSFVNLYADFDIHPVFSKKFFDNVYLTFTDSSNKRTNAFWDSIRPVPLQVEEQLDYIKKDSIEQAHNSAAYLDSMDKKANKISLPGFLLLGQSFNRRSHREYYSIYPVMNAISFNTVEGWVVNLEGTYTKRLDSIRDSRKAFLLSPTLRYGFSNHHLNGSLRAGYTFGKQYYSSFSLSGGRDVFQFNNTNPITPLTNTYSTLFEKRNLMKIYEAWFARAGYTQGLGDGLTVLAVLEYQDRLPLENTTDFKIRDVSRRQFTPNYPVERIGRNITRHQALVSSFTITWQPGGRYIRFPDRKISIGSKYPRLQLNYTKGYDQVLGSDVNYDKWRFSISDNLNLKLAGKFRYRWSIGGFIHRSAVEFPDYQHFNGNQSVFAGAYVSSFQLAPYYLNSTASTFYTTLNAEHHFGGLLTGKIPGIQKLNWYLVGGTNTFYVNPKNNYIEVFAGLENIFRVLRVDFVQSFSTGRSPFSAIRLGFQGAILGN